MQTRSNISIPLPCHENWDEMTQAEQGRFCNACSKTVVDFSLMSNEEIIAYLNRNTGKVCGRFTETQLKPQREISQKLKVFLYALFSVFLLQISEYTFAQKKHRTLSTILPVQYRSMYGKVTDESKAGLKFAIVNVYEKDVLKNSTYTDSEGNYSIPGLNAGVYEIEVISFGMIPKLITDVVLENSIMFDIQLEKLILYQAEKTETIVSGIMGGVSYERRDVNPIFRVATLHEMLEIMDTRCIFRK